MAGAHTLAEPNLKSHCDAHLPPNQCPYQLQSPARPDTMGEKNIPTALKGCGVKIESLLFTSKTSPPHTHTKKDQLLISTKV